MTNRHFSLVQGQNFIFCNEYYVNAYPNLFDFNEDELLVLQN